MKGLLKELFYAHFGEPADTITPLKSDGSNREIYRLANAHCTVIGVSNPDRQENVAFVEFSKHFRKAGLPVPLIYVEDLDRGLYLEEDLGDTTLFAYLTEIRSREGFSQRLIDLYTQVVQILPQFQIIAGKTLDYKLCYPRGSFDKQSMMWDLNYFKYYFLKLAQIPFNEQALEDDFDRFTKYLLAAERDFFMYRDFQSRNIMIKDDAPYFLDYQGGRKGALQYDIASLLFDAKADIPFTPASPVTRRATVAVSCSTVAPIKPDVRIMAKEISDKFSHRIRASFSGRRKKYSPTRHQGLPHKMLHSCHTKCGAQ